MCALQDVVARSSHALRLTLTSMGIVHVVHRLLLSWSVPAATVRTQLHFSVCTQCMNQVARQNSLPGM